MGVCPSFLKGKKQVDTKWIRSHFTEAGGGPPHVSDNDGAASPDDARRGASPSQVSDDSGASSPPHGPPDSGGASANTRLAPLDIESQEPLLSDELARARQQVEQAAALADKRIFEVDLPIDAYRHTCNTVNLH